MIAALAASGSGDASFELSGGGVMLVSTGHDLGLYERLFETATEAGVLVETDLTLPEDARLQAAHFTVAAEPADPATIASVATVRPAAALNSDSVGATIDFGRIVTVAGVTTGDVAVLMPSIEAVHRWDGTGWRFVAFSGFFTELATERLLVESQSGVSSESLADALLGIGAVHLPAVPTGLELLVGGTTVWFERQGSSPITSTAPPESAAVSFVVDRTDAVRDAFARAPVVDGLKMVRIGLRAATPGRLTLAPSIAALRVHTVTFPPDGLVRSLDLAEEGEVRFNVTPPEAADVREVAFTTRGSFGPERVQPAVGPDLLTDAHLVLAPGRPVLLGLPDKLTARFGSLTGVRLVLRAAPDTNGGEVTGRLLADVAGRPGDPLPGGDLTPLTVGPGVERFWTLTFAEDVDPPVLTPPDVDAVEPLPPLISAWLELQLGHGSVECGFTGADPNDPLAPGAVVLRRLPGGGTAELTDIPSLGPLRAAIRIVGRPDRDRPIPAVVLGVEGTTDTIGVTPTADDLTTVLTLASPMPVTGAVELAAVAAAPGTLTLDTVRVTYREVEDG